MQIRRKVSIRLERVGDGDGQRLHIAGAEEAKGASADVCLAVSGLRHNQRKSG